MFRLATTAQAHLALDDWAQVPELVLFGILFAPAVAIFFACLPRERQTAGIEQLLDEHEEDLTDSIVGRMCDFIDEDGKDETVVDEQGGTV